MTVVIAGGTRGIGLELAAALTEQGETVIIGYGSDNKSADMACTRLAAAGLRPIAVRADMGSPDGSNELIKAAAQRGDPIRILVHSTVRVVTGQLMGISDSDLEHTLAVNATSRLNSLATVFG